MPKIANITSKNLEEAAEILTSGGLVALPTETVYGLAAHALQDKAVRRVYAVKGRPSHNPLIVHIMDSAHAEHWAKVNSMARTLIQAFWPGPLTLVLPKSSRSVSRIAGAELETVALRCPKTTWATAFKNFGFDGPLVMPSANRSGHVSPTTAQHVADDLGDKVDMILDGGECQNGIESTVLKIEEDHAIVLRPGAIPAEEFVPFISDLRLASKPGKLIAPGMMKSHYAPKAHVRLDATNKRAGENYIAFGPTDLEADFNISPTGDLKEAARNLYSALRLLDNKDVIAVAPVPTEGLGAAINDRLRRAAANKEH